MEVGESAAKHESCCKSLPVAGFADPRWPGKTVYLGKYEVTAGRIRTWLEELSSQQGVPNVRGWVSNNAPPTWKPSWSTFLPTNRSGDKVTINRLLLGDPRHDGQTQSQAGPGVVLPPATDQVVDLGTDFQFGSQVYADLHGNNCATFSGSYGFPTFFYPADVLARDKQLAREDALGFLGETIPAQQWLDTKSMNCITNAMLQAFCAWDGGELATNEVLEFITSSPSGRSETVSGCGTQYDNHGNLLGNSMSGTVQTGGVCPAVSSINATFDAGDALPVAGSSLNSHRYHYPDLQNSTSDKTWQIASPGRVAADVIKLPDMSEGWHDLAGNLSEQVYVPKTGLFGLRHRGIGYGSSRSDLNVTLMPGETILRVQRPEAKSALSGGRCMYFR